MIYITSQVFNENVIYTEGFLNPVQQDYIMDMTG